MAETAVMVAAAAAAAQIGSSYRVKFARKEFLELVETAKPKIIYKRKKMYFFAFDGFVMYSMECHDEDFQKQKIIKAIEFSSQPWST